tara:strand:- start:4313 stop:5455 length:1143 start_codon:yes stop_codon:yes gene_type:complete
MRYLILLFFFLALASSKIYAQSDSSSVKKLSFTGDFRFRVEQDWNSRKSDGTYRENRSRLRYRFRFGANYQVTEWAEFGMRIRTGFREKQQDPQLTLGEGFKEFSSVPIGFEKLFFKAQYGNFMGWLGKNTFPFEKQNELFWSDHVYPDGVFISGKFPLENSLINSIQVNTGHFILASSGSTFDQDQYLQGIQLTTKYWNNRLTLFPSFYYFHQMPNIPDGNETFNLDYSILHIGAKAKVVKKPQVEVGVDYYYNLENLSQNDSIPQAFKNQKNGIIASINFWELKSRGDWVIGSTFSYIEKYAIVDFFAQNDWVRWDYSSNGSPDGRLSNFKGLELNAAYLIRKNFRLKMRYFMVDQLIAFGTSKETGNRIRLDLDIGF